MAAHTDKAQILVPKLRFKEFDGEWRMSQFGKLYKFYTTNSFSRDKLNYESGKVKNIHYGDIHTKFQSYFYLNNEYVPFVNDDLDLSKIKDEAFCKIGDLIIADASEDYADIGKTIEIIDINDEKVIAGLHTFLARPFSKETYIGFISYLLKSWNLRKQIMTIAQGTKVLGLSMGRFSQLKLNTPSLPEQQKIASFLSAVDEKIQQLNKKKTLLEQYKKGVMQQLFSGDLRFKDENGGDFPDWEENKQLGTLTYKVGKKNKNNIQYPIYSINNQEGFRPQSEQFDGLDSNDRGYDISLYKIVDAETFAYNPARINVGSIGYSYDLKRVIVSSLYVCFKTKDTLEDLFLLAYLDTYSFQKDILRYEEGGVRQYLFYDNFSHIKIPLPTTQEQQKIANYLSAIDTKIETVNQQINKTQAFKKGLLQGMFV
ncbi:restriction modification system DNA specificity domain protein [Cellulophaga algicola DSM 14237]|uniref:Restriction modification system DNA specificity domain protein n=1 Tax=Cellulophaga algicola (strain DSM 14237 / IC166 / ACAM 630) TaxID=688270 RepID=E6XEV7_CELAD|nr:restriction endonuclease subunit S [Cellulophaga algicola]ADV48159.1 restriction modification system DNA specificity domain protein [Cellulophaga algicola DSM 14237]